MAKNKRAAVKSPELSWPVIFYFVRSGYVVLPNTAGTFRGAGRGADYWSSRGSAATNAYDLAFTTGVYPSDGPSNRWYGFPSAALVVD